MQYIILFVNNVRKKYGIEQWPAELPNMHTKTISINRWCLITEKVPFVNSKPGLEYRYFWKLWVWDISIKPYLLSPLQTLFTDYPTSTTLKLTITPNQQIDSFALSALLYRPSAASDVGLISWAYDLYYKNVIATFKSDVLYTIIYHFCTLP